MGNSKVLPPGDSPDDPAVKDIDAVAFALNKVHTYLVWIDEHRASFEAARTSDPIAFTYTPRDLSKSVTPQIASCSVASNMWSACAQAGGMVGPTNNACPQV